jgi:GAF domain-containing protein
MPLTDEQGVVGVAQVFGAEAGAFAPAAVGSLQSVCRAAALALENARLYDRAGALFALANTLSTTLDLQAVGDFIAQQIALAMGAKGCTVRGLDRGTRRLELIGAYGLSKKYLLEKGPVLAGENIAEVLAGKPSTIRDVANDSRMQYPSAAIEEGIKSLATVPMVVKGVVTGIVRVYTDQIYDFASEDVAFLCAAAGVAGAAVENSRLYDGIRQDFEVLVDEIVYMRRAARAVGGSREAQK